jgi:alcohol dehydrogenase class IV
MNYIKILGCRIYQRIMYVASSFLSFREPILKSGENSSSEIYKILKENKIDNVLVVTDNSLFSLGLLNPMLDGLDNNGIKYYVYHDVVPNPTVNNVSDALLKYKQLNCHALVAFGGGSSLDTAKAVGALVVNPNKQVDKLKGLLKVHHHIPLLIAIPTTAGTGSETTVAAVIVDKEKNDKYAINDPKLIPSYAVLDPTLLVGLPSKITSTTGMDALTHAIEAYIGKSNTKKTKKYALEAILLIKDNLLLSFQNPTNLSYREAMQNASYKAGVSFTRAYVGYVHALAHAIGGKYNVPHGLANAIILPYVLRSYGKKAYKKLAQIYDYIALGDLSVSKEEKANRIITWIDSLNQQMAINNNLKEIIQVDDLDFLSRHADKEANPLYPVPKEFNATELKQIYKNIIK